MKVKVKKEGKVKEFKLISSWEDVTLEKWLQLIDFETGSKTEEATETIAALSNIPKQLVKELALSDVAVIMNFEVHFRYMLKYITFLNCFLAYWTVPECFVIWIKVSF